MLVYRARNITNGLVYIGATRASLDKRIALHFYSAFSDEQSTPFYDALRSGGIKAFEWDVLHETESESDLWRLEREAIERFDCRVPKGYNQTLGGMGGGWAAGRKRGPMSEAERRKRSVAQRGRKPWNKGLSHTFQTREKMRGRVPWNKGVPRTDAEKATMRAAIQASGHHGGRHPNVKPLECDGVTYQSVREMERKTGMSRAGIYYRLAKGRARFIEPSRKDN